MAQPARKKSGNMLDQQGSSPRSARPNAKNAAAKLASMIEQDMSDLKLSEEEKNVRVSRFAKRVDVAIEHRAKS